MDSLKHIHKSIHLHLLRSSCSDISRDRESMWVKRMYSLYMGRGDLGSRLSNKKSISRVRKRATRSGKRDVFRIRALLVMKSWGPHYSKFVAFYMEEIQDTSWYRLRVVSSNYARQYTVRTLAILVP